MGFAPTSEQAHILDMGIAGHEMAVEALAGSGKTSTIKLLADNLPGRGLYWAFNKKIVEEAKTKFPRETECRTVHSVAFGRVGRNYRQRLNGRRIYGDELGRALGFDGDFAMVFGSGEDTYEIDRGRAGSLVMQALQLFCQSRDEVPSEKHFPRVKGIDEPKQWSNNNELRSMLLPYLESAWRDLQEPHGAVPYEHYVYLKQMALLHPQLPYDFLFIDEAQDISPVMAGMIDDQRGNTQVIAVGDSHQCQPPGTRVDVVVRPGSGSTPPVIEQRPIESIVAGDLVVAYDKASGVGNGFRTNGCRVLGAAHRHYAGRLISAKTADAGKSHYTPNHRCLVKSDGLLGKHFVYVMRRGDDYRIGKSQFHEGQSTSFIRARQERADDLWVLDIFDTAAEALFAEQAIAARFGLPQITFVPVNAGSVWDAEMLDRLWFEIGDNRAAAERALAAFGRDHEFPIWSNSGGRFMVRRPQFVRACNLLDGMSMLNERTREWERVAIGGSFYDGPVHSLEVEEHHTYVADGLVTGNSIYGFTGAGNYLREANLANTAHLSKSFRFGPEIAEVANVILRRLDSDVLVEGGGQPGAVGEVSDRATFLARTNGGALVHAFSAMDLGLRPFVVGGTKDAEMFVKGALDLQMGRRAIHNDLAGFASWDQVLAYVKADELGADLKTLVGLVEKMGASYLLARLKEIPQNERGSDLTVSTAHKSKGCEWPEVRIAGDFPIGDDVGDEELRLMYVAVTRAETVLDASLLDYEGVLAPDNKDAGTKGKGTDGVADDGSVTPGGSEVAA